MELEQFDDYILVNGQHKLYLSRKLQQTLMEQYKSNEESALDQIEKVLEEHKKNKKHSLKICGLSDMHTGYTFPVGSVIVSEELKKEDSSSFLVSFNGIGGDINCGVRCIVTDIFYEDIKNDIKNIADDLYEMIPTVGNSKIRTKDGNITQKEMKVVLEKGVDSLDEMELFLNGEKLSRVDAKKGGIENNGSVKTKVTNTTNISQKILGKGIQSLGSIGSGNHYVEIQRIEKVFIENTALKKDQIVIFIHCGSRGLGHEINAIYFKNEEMFEEILASEINKCTNDKMNLYNAAVNYAFMNREVIGMVVQHVFKKYFKEIKMQTLTDCGHNIIKVEEVQGKNCLIHRKGASRVEPNGFVAVGGSMATASYLLQGDECEKTYFSTCHGAGREIPRGKAHKLIKFDSVIETMEGIEFRCSSKKGMIEEAGECYKKIEDVIDHCVKVRIVKKVSKNKPIAVIKG